jgi:hypothetical protein
MRRLVVILAAVVVSSNAVLAQSADGVPASGSPNAAQGQGEADAKNTAAADKSKTAKNAVRALKGDAPIHGNTRIKTKNTNAVAVDQKKNQPDNTGGAPGSQ